MSSTHSFKLAKTADTKRSPTRYCKGFGSAGALWLSGERLLFLAVLPRREFKTHFPILIRHQIRGEWIAGFGDEFGKEIRSARG